MLIFVFGGHIEHEVIAIGKDFVTISKPAIMDVLFQEGSIHIADLFYIL